MADGIQEWVKTLTPQKLDLYKRNLRTRVETMSDTERDQLYKYVQGIPELSDIISRPSVGQATQQITPKRVYQGKSLRTTVPSTQKYYQTPDLSRTEPLGAFKEIGQAPTWQKPLAALSAPFETVTQNVFTPVAAGLTMLNPNWWLKPYMESLTQKEIAEIQSQSIPERLRSLMPGGKLRQGYEEWKSPSGVKFALENIPWLAIPGAGATTKVTPIAGQQASALRVGTGVAGALERVGLGTAGKIVEYSPWGLMEKGTGAAIGKAGEKITQKITPKLKIKFAVPSNEELSEQITRTDWQKNILQKFKRNPVIKDIAKVVGGKAAIVSNETLEDTTDIALMVGQRARETFQGGGAAQLAQLQQIHLDPKNLFGIDDVTSIASKVKPKVAKASLAWNDIFEHPLNYVLTDGQRAYINKFWDVEDAIKFALDKEDIIVKDIPFDEFSHWVHRVVLGKATPEGIAEANRGLGRIGAKQSFMKQRFYEEALQGIQNNVVYEANPEQVMNLYIRSAAKAVGDKRIADILVKYGEKPLERAWKTSPQVMQSAKEIERQLASTKQLQKVVNRALRGEKIPEVTLQAHERRLPELAARLRNALGNTDDLNALRKTVNDTVESLMPTYKTIRGARAKVLQIARTPRMGESVIAHPAFQGKIYPESVAGELTKYWSDLGSGALHKAATVSGGIRTMIAAGDFSAMWIQGAPSLARYPRQWAQGTKEGFRAFFTKGGSLAKYMSQNADDIQQRVFYGGSSRAFEMVESTPLVEKTAKMMFGKAGQKLTQQTYGRFEAFFNAFGEVLKDELWKGLRNAAKSETDLFDIARHIDRLTGVMSSKAIGIGGTQRALESSFTFFASQYTRASMSLANDVLRGGMTGKLAREALGSMAGAGALAYFTLSQMLGQEPNFDATSGRFMTIKVTDPITGDARHVGIGGAQTALARLGGDVAASALSLGENSPVDFVKMSRFDNPFLRFMYSRTAPITSFAAELISGRNYFGEPFEGPLDYMRLALEQVVPIALQETFAKGQKPTLAGIVTEEMGLRSFPMSDAEKRNILRDKLSQQKYGMTWDDVGMRMGAAYQREIERESPELRESTEKAQASYSKTARGSGKVWTAFNEYGDQIEKQYADEVRRAANEVEATQDWIKFREDISDAKLAKRKAYALRNMMPEYQEIQDYFSEPLSQETYSRMNPNDIIMKEYNRVMFAPNMYDQYGNYRADIANDIEQLFINRYGKQAMDYIEKYQTREVDDLTPMKILKQAQDALQPYWNIMDTIYSQYPPEVKQVAEQIEILENMGQTRQARQLQRQYPQILSIRTKIERAKLKWRRENPDATRLLKMFY